MDDEPLTPFEERLQRIAPAAPSEALRGRIAEQLEPRRLSRRPYTLGLAGLAAAACVVVGVGVWMAVSSVDTPESPGANHQVVEAPAYAPAPDTPQPPPETDLPAMADAPAGSLLAYQRAMRDAPELLSFVIDQQAASGRDGARLPSAPSRPLRVMDATMFLHEDERCDG